jgi:hypothetical protein
LLAVLELPVALYEVDEEADSCSCSDWRNCCRMSAAELALEELLALSLEEAPSSFG